MSTRVRISIYTRRTNRNRPRKFLNRCCASRHILCSSPLPLCIINGGRICYFCWIFSLISSIHWLQPSPPLRKGSLLSNVRRSQLNIFPTTLPRTSWNATTIFRLPRCLYTLKHRFFYRVYHLACGNAAISVPNLRSIRRTTGMYSSRICPCIFRVTICLFPSFPSHI